jgi:hypothetical protein
MLNILRYQGNVNQTTLRVHLTPVTMATNKDPITKAGEDVGIIKCLYTFDGNVY